MKQLATWTALTVGAALGGLTIFGTGAAVTAVITPAAAAPLMIAALGGLGVFGAGAALAAAIPDDIHDVFDPDPSTTVRSAEPAANVHFLRSAAGEQQLDKISA